MEMPLKVAVIDQQRVFVDALSFRLGSEPLVQVVCHAEQLEQGWDELKSAQPDLLILDADFSLGRSFDLAADIRRELPSTRIIFLYRNLSDGLIDQALRIRAEGILSRAETLSEVVQALRRVAAGQRVFSVAVDSKIELDASQNEYRLRGDASSKGLTDRQLEILRYLARGESVKAVARRLFLSPKSVDNQKFRIMHKIGVRDKVSLALYAVREGLIQP